MEIEQLRKEINHLLENVVEHSNSYSDNKPIPSLEISFILTKINKLHETMSILKYLLEEQERKTIKASILAAKSKSVVVIIENKITPTKKQIKTVEDNFKQKPIVKLIDAFSLNDRYLFANELFHK